MNVLQTDKMMEKFIRVYVISKDYRDSYKDAVEKAFKQVCDDHYLEVGGIKSGKTTCKVGTAQVSTSEPQVKPK